MHLSVVVYKCKIAVIPLILKIRKMKFIYTVILIFPLFVAKANCQNIVPKLKKNEVIEFSDDIYKYRIELLNKRTPIELEFNEHVKHYIDLFNSERREQFSKIVGLSKMYFPLYEEKLDKYDIPYELKYLSIVESALDPMAVSPSGAVGLWQFKINTGRMFDLNVDSYVDDRRDPIKSTEAACQYLNYLYRIFDDWQLAISAYNGGPGSIRNAIEKSGGKRNFWEIYPYLPEQTKKYLPAFVAVNYLMNHYKEHGIEEKLPEYTYYETDTVHINNPLTFYDVQKVLDLSIWQIRSLNPSYKRNFVPFSKSYRVMVLPKHLIRHFKDNLDIIYSDESGRADGKKFSPDDEKKGLMKISHVVKNGEFLHKIAIQYKCTIEDILAWNQITISRLRKGQKLILWVKPEVHESLLGGKKEVFTLSNGKKSYFYYVVQKGDSLDKIVNKFNGVSDEDVRKLNNLKINEHPTPGERLIINVAK